MTLADLFPEQDYRFHFRFERASIAGFFRPTAQHDQLIAERRFWLQTVPSSYAALLPEGEPLLEAAISFAHQEQTLTPDASSLFAPQATPFQRCVHLGSAWEPDFLLLQAQPDGVVRLLGGCVCFPSSWSLAEKIGRPIEAIHD